MLFLDVSSLQQVIKLDAYFYSKSEHFSLSYSWIDRSRKQYAIEPLYGCTWLMR